ncbi:MAG TPA: sigma-54-dependent Fis family transcriptional regulator [candidate division WOR-3 bacterium]|uniref:Sigma-54-dependent Fis family transcriptional regulator n=1 Tax=candidate division WOR-3 bacterium TaxID=2052148 RepID=A0A9C9ENA7_UNCW3|nr:sigma-54-dependent Fis family transcriptional regulator [candidate division WOR-3 bacterium]
MNKRKSIIKESIKRCREMGLNPDVKRLRRRVDKTELHRRQKRHKFLLDAALPYMMLMAETFKECGSLTALLDSECCILKIVGPRKVLASRKKYGLVEGAFLCEEDAGTNAASLCLKTRKPFYVSGTEYFTKFLRNGSCFAAPVIDSGLLLGIIVIIHPNRKSHPHTFALVKTLAHLISREYTEITQGNFIISVCDLLNNGIVLTEQNGRVWYVNFRARQILEIGRGENIRGDFNIDLFSSNRISNEIVYSRRTKSSFMVTRKQYSNKFLFLFEPLKEKLEKDKKIKAVFAPYTTEDIIGLNEIKQKIRHLAMQDINILIVGESGTGKELIASALHNASHRAAARFVVVNCAAIPDTLFEAELFGYSKGAFTDARYDRVGRIEYASCGTLFLDEIGDLPFDVQGKLLRVLETKKVSPLGGNKEKKIDVRFIFATNRNLEKMVREGKFREDLYYRINTPVINIPPLRERKAEIPNLIEHILLKLKDNHHGFIAGLTEEAVSLLMEYDYPGNVRELEGIIRQAFLTCRKEYIDADDIGLKTGQPVSLKEKVRRYRANLVYETFLAHSRDVKKVSRLLDLSIRQVYRCIKEAEKN